MTVRDLIESARNKAVTTYQQKIYPKLSSLYQRRHVYIKACVANNNRVEKIGKILIVPFIFLLGERYIVDVKHNANHTEIQGYQFSIVEYRTYSRRMLITKIAVCIITSPFIATGFVLIGVAQLGSQTRRNNAYLVKHLQIEAGSGTPPEIPIRNTPDWKKYPLDPQKDHLRGQTVIDTGVHFHQNDGAYLINKNDPLSKLVLDMKMVLFKFLPKRDLIRLSLTCRRLYTDVNIYAGTIISEIVRLKMHTQIRELFVTPDIVPNMPKNVPNMLNHHPRLVEAFQTPPLPTYLHQAGTRTLPAGAAGNPPVVQYLMQPYRRLPHAEYNTHHVFANVMHLTPMAMGRGRQNDIRWGLDPWQRAFIAIRYTFAQNTCGVLVLQQMVPDDDTKWEVFETCQRKMVFANRTTVDAAILQDWLNRLIKGEDVGSLCMVPPAAGVAGAVATFQESPITVAIPGIANPVPTIKIGCTLAGNYYGDYDRHTISTLLTQLHNIPIQV
jgi:hypothetical protein